MTFPVAPLKTLGAVRVSNVDKHTVEGHAAVRLCNYVDVYKNETVVDDMAFMEATATQDQIKAFRLRPGDTVFTKDSETADDIGIPAYIASAGDDLICGYHLAIFRPRPDRIVPRFAFWAMKSGPVMARWETTATGVTRVGLKSSDIRKLPLPAPPLTEQRAIADYLDRETAKIDTLIEKQTTMIERLRERRTEVVLHAVSKGIDENASMRHVDIPWIQEMPAHWRETALRRVARFTGGSGFPVDEQGLEDEAISFYKVNALARSDGDGVIRATYDTVSRETAARLGAAVVPAGTLVIAKIGAALLLGRIRMLAHDSCIDNNMLAISPRPTLDPRFAFHALRAVRMDLLVNPGAVPSLSEKWFRAYQIPVPPLDEQREIAGYLDRETVKIDTLITKVERHIELAKERRAALITAAVTGQIDVTTSTQSGDAA